MGPFSLVGLLLVPIMVGFGCWELVRWAARRDKWLGEAGVWMVAVALLLVDVAALIAAAAAVGPFASGWWTGVLIGVGIGTVPLWKWLGRQEVGRQASESAKRRGTSEDAS